MIEAGGTEVSTIDELVTANGKYAEGFSKGDLASPPSRRVAVVTCMDARILPSRVLGLEEGDAHVIRNAGGDAREALRSLAVSQHLLGTKEIAVIRHTDCGMGKYTNEQMQQKIAEASGGDTDGVDFRPFSDLEEAVREDVRFLKESPLIAADTPVRGFVYEVESGRVREVV
jgi:carbonic anhydrase